MRSPRHWLFSFRTADGCEKHESHLADKPPPMFVRLIPPERRYAPGAVPVEVHVLTRTYVLYSHNPHDRTALYVEAVQ